MSESTLGEITLRRAESEDRASILELLAASMGWGEDDRYRRFFTWKHDENPFGSSPAWVAELDGQLVGLRTWLRWRFEGFGRSWTTVRAVDTATHPAARGRGVFTRLTMHSVEALSSDGVDFVFNTPNEKSRPGYLKMGWTSLGTLPTAVRFDSLRAAAKTLQARQPADKWSLPSDVGLSAPAAFASDGADRWLSHRPPSDGRLRTALSPDVLRWRYGLADLDYRVLTDDHHGCVVFRHRKRGPAVEAVVCLVLARTDTSRRVLLRRLGRESGADHVLQITGDVCWRAGFIPLPGQGPVLTHRTLASSKALALSDFDVCMGDVELF